MATSRTSLARTRLVFAVLLAAVVFHRWRKNAWSKLGLDFKEEKKRFGSIRFFTRHVFLALALLFLGLSLANLQWAVKSKSQSKRNRCHLCARC